MEQLLEQIENFIDLAERMKNAYFFTPPSSVGGRISYAQKHRFPSLMAEFDLRKKNCKTKREKVTLNIEAYCNCSCKNVYFYKSIFINHKQTNLKALKSLFERIKQEC